jgi:ketosteroid isomerase-like protein
MSYSGHGTIHLAWGDLKAEVGDLAITVVVLHFTKVSERTPGHHIRCKAPATFAIDRTTASRWKVSHIVQRYISWWTTAMS